ncbi:hypothetical protein [Terasakiella pusilla]|uniref:hypothetical protein n=1 Tax=Terasakiella pusilla TaxID=64973 RepID=UPI003AA99128
MGFTYYGLILFSVLWGSWGFHELYNHWGKDFNEVGDFLAGWFSPMAFLWFVYAVFLQRAELVETRRELKRQADAQEHQHQSQTVDHIIEMIRDTDTSESKEEIKKDLNSLIRLLHIVLREMRQTHSPIKINVQPFSFDRIKKEFEGYASFKHERLKHQVSQLIIKLVSKYNKEINILDSIAEHKLQHNHMIRAMILDTDWQELVQIHTLVYSFYQYEFRDGRLEIGVEYEFALERSEPGA